MSIVVALTGVAGHAQAPKVFRVSGTIREASGAHTIRVHLWSAEAFSPHPRRDVLLPARDVTFAFRVPSGRWAISAYEDLNENGTLDRGVFRPKEPSGVSLFRFDCTANHGSPMSRSRSITTFVATSIFRTEGDEVHEYWTVSLLRALHVLLAALWVGSTAFTTFQLLPVIHRLGPVGGVVMIRLNQQRLTRFIAAISGTTVLTGLYLLWHFTGFDPQIGRSHAGIAFGTGGIAGLIAAILSGAIVGRSFERLTKNLEQATTTTDGPQQGELMRTATRLRQRVTTFGTVVLVFQVIALVLMAIGHYV